MRFYLNKKDLISCPMVQDDEGVYYWNGKSYWKPTIKHFYDKPPRGYRRYDNGSHGPKYAPCNGCYYYQKALDFSGRAGTKITCDKDVKVLAVSNHDGGFSKVKIEGRIIWLVHTRNFRKGLIKAGNTICELRSPEGHLHIFLSGGRIKNIILAGTDMDYYKAGQIIETSQENVRLRRKPGLSGEFWNMQKGTLMTCSDAGKEVSGYRWQYVRHVTPQAGGKSSEGWVAIKFTKKSNFPKNDCNRCEDEKKVLQAQIKRKTQEIAQLKNDKISLEAQLGKATADLSAEKTKNEQLRKKVVDLGVENNSLNKRVEELEAIIAKDKIDIKDMSERIVDLTDKNNRLEVQVSGYEIIVGKQKTTISKQQGEIGDLKVKLDKCEHGCECSCSWGKVLKCVKDLLGMSSTEE